MNEYSPLKVIHHRDRIDALSKGNQIVPTQVQLIISDLCNHDCSFCAYRMSGYTSNQLFTLNSHLSAKGTNNPVRMIEYPKIVEILDDCKEMGVGAIQITGGGEPTVHPQFTSIIGDVLNHDLDLALVTNGSKLTQLDIDILNHAAWVRVSVDAGDKATYSRIRGVDGVHWDRVWKNIRKLGRTETTLGIGFVVTKDNYHEVVKATHLAREAGASNIRISAVFQSDDDDYFSSFHEQTSDLCREAEEYSTDTFTVFNNFNSRLKDLHQRTPDYDTCHYQQFVTYIGGDLNVYRCCNLAYNERGILGSLKNQSLKEFWVSHGKQEKIRSFNAKECPRCMFNSVNKTIIYTLDPEPKHVNFV